MNELHIHANEQILLDELKPRVDLWEGTPFEGYIHLSSKAKGRYGELFISSYLASLGFTLTERTSVGNDEVVNGIPTEYKFSLSQAKTTKAQGHILVPNKFMINHVAVHKDWQRLIFVGINPSDCASPFIWFSKEDFMQELQLADCLFKRQQGGEKGDNDDYILSGESRITEFLDRPYVRTIDQW